MVLPFADAGSCRWRRCGAAITALVLAILAVGPLPDATAERAPQKPRSEAKSVGKNSSVLPSRSHTKVLADRYIVELVDGANAAEVARDYRGTVKVQRRYSTALTGFSAAMPAAAAETLRADTRVASVEADVELTLSATQKSPPWGLDRMDQRRRPLDGTYTPATSGAGVSIYIVDTGVYRNHNQFGDRVRSGYDATGSGSTADCVGHGTHVAGTAAGATFGVAKRARIIPIRVLNCRGSGTKSQLIAGLDWLVRDHKRGEPAVANLSLGGAASRVVDGAVNRVLDDGVTVVAAAGNEGDTWGDACYYSPARVRGALTVGATNRYDQAPLWSNFGQCLDLFAPGDNIKSAALGYRSASATESGTSMAAPFVSGAAALFLANHRSAGPRRVADVLKSRATPGIVAYAGPNTTQKLLHMPGRTPTRISASLSDTVVYLGEVTRVRATLRNAVSGRPISDKTLKVYRRNAGATTWHHLANRTTDRDGKIRVRHQPWRATQYRVRHVSTPTTRSDVSDIVKVAVGKAITVLSADVAPEIVTYGDPVTVSGILQRAIDDKLLADELIELQHRTAGTTNWSSLGSQRTDTHGSVEFVHDPQLSTEYRLLYGGNSSLLADISAIGDVVVLAGP